MARREQISISDARDLHGLHTDEISVLLWFIEHGTAVDDTTLELMQRDTRIKKARIIDCIFTLGECGLLQCTSKFAFVMPTGMEQRSP